MWMPDIRSLKQYVDAKHQILEAIELYSISK